MTTLYHANSLSYSFISLVNILSLVLGQNSTLGFENRFFLCVFRCVTCLLTLIRNRLFFQLSVTVKSGEILLNSWLINAII